MSPFYLIDVAKLRSRDHVSSFAEETRTPVLEGLLRWFRRTFVG
jgi:hypothetical protein